MVCSGGSGNRGSAVMVKELVKELVWEDLSYSIQFLIHISREVVFFVILKGKRSLR